MSRSRRSCWFYEQDTAGGQKGFVELVPGPLREGNILLFSRQALRNRKACNDHYSPFSGRKSSAR